jgi:hypothetical protein
LGIVSQIYLSADDKARNAWTVVMNLRKPLLLDVFKRCGRSYTKANEENVRLRVRKWTKPVVVLLTYRQEHKVRLEATMPTAREQTSSIKKTKSVGVVSNHNSDGIIIEYLDQNVRPFRRRGLETLLTVGTYSLGNLLVVYDINKHVCNIPKLVSSWYFTHHQSVSSLKAHDRLHNHLSGQDNDDQRHFFG